MSVGFSQCFGGSVLFSATGELFLGIVRALGHGPPLYKGIVARSLRRNRYSLQD